MTNKIKKQLSDIREDINICLQAVGDKFGADIQLGNIRYNHEDGELTSFSSQIKYTKRGIKDERETRYEEYIERIVKNKLIPKSSIPTCHLDGGRDMSFVGLDFKKRKNIFMIRSADGKKYNAGMGYFLDKCFENGFKKPKNQDEYDIIESNFRKWLFMYL